MWKSVPHFPGFRCVPLFIIYLSNLNLCSEFNASIFTVCTILYYLAQFDWEIVQFFSKQSTATPFELYENVSETNERGKTTQWKYVTHGAHTHTHPHAYPPDWHTFDTVYQKIWYFLFLKGFRFEFLCINSQTYAQTHTYSQRAHTRLILNRFDTVKCGNVPIWLTHFINEAILYLFLCVVDMRMAEQVATIYDGNEYKFVRRAHNFRVCLCVCFFVYFQNAKRR